MKTLLAAVVLMLSLAGSAGADPADRLDAARMLIFDRDWPKAVAELRRVLVDRNEPLRDEASFWLAHSLFQLGDPSEALRVIDGLEREHPRSRWVLPAGSLRVQIATRFDRPDVLWRVATPPAPAPTPRTPRSPTTPRTPVAIAPPAPPRSGPPQPVALTATDVRIQALSGLLLHDPDRAVPVLREIVVQELDSPQARRALFVLGLSPNERARETVMHFAQTGPDPLRVVAVEQMGRWRSANVRYVLTSVYASGSGRVKLEVLRSLGEARGDRELIRIARAEKDDALRGYAVTQLRLLDTEAARVFLRTVK